MTEEKMYIPEDVKNDAERMAKEDNIPLERIKEYMREEYFDPVLISVYPDPKADNGARARQALLAARSRIASEKGDENVSYKGIIILKGPSEVGVSIKNSSEYVFMDIHGIFSRENDTPKIIKVRLFGDAVTQVANIPEKEMIQINFSEKEDDKYGISLSATKLFWKKLEGEKVDITAMLKKVYGDPKTVNEIEYTAGQKDEGSNEYKRVLLSCRVKSVSVRISKEKEYKYATYTVYSDDDGPDKVAYIMVPLSMATCDAKSSILVIGENRPKDDKYKDKPISIWADIIVPVIRYPLATAKLESMVQNAVSRKKTQSNVARANGPSIPSAGNLPTIDEVDDGGGWDL